MLAAGKALAWTVGVLGLIFTLGCHAGTHDVEPGSSTAPRAESEPDVELSSIPGLDVSEMTEHEQGTLTTLLKEQLSPCGDPRSVGECAQKPGSCGACVPASKYLARLVMEGFETSVVGEQYRARFQEPSRTFEMDGAAVRGAPMAPITIVEFSDFQCPHCGRAHPVLTQALAKFQGQVKLVFKHYPLPGHPRALPAAKAAEAARRQGKFWEMHDLLFEHQHALEDSDLLAYAERIGLDMARFQADLGSAEVTARVEQDKAEGQAATVEGTPTLYINGHRFSESLRTLEAYLQEETGM